MRRLPSALAVAALALGCYSVSYGPAGYERHGVWLPRKGPSPHQPKERIEIDGRELVFDEALRVYRVIDLEGHFFSGGRFYRWADESWESARSLGGPWTEIRLNELPPTLAALPTAAEGGDDNSAADG